MALAKEGLSGTLMGCMLGCGIFSFSFMYPGFEPKVALTVAVSLPVSSKKVMRENMKNLMLRLFCFSKIEKKSDYLAMGKRTRSCPTAGGTKVETESCSHCSTTHDHDRGCHRLAHLLLHSQVYYWL